MQKIFKFKEWLTLEDSAKYLSAILDEAIRVDELLQLALDGHLILSLNLVNYTKARRGKVTQEPNITFHAGDNDGNPGVNLMGVLDLPMIGAERIEVEQCYQRAVNGPKVRRFSVHGVLLQREKGRLFQLIESVDDIDRMLGELPEGQRHERQLSYHSDMTQINQEQIEQLRENFFKAKAGLQDDDENRDYYRHFPAKFFPRDAVLVVRTKNLTDFLQSLSDTNSVSRQELSLRAETTYLNIIGALLEVTTGPYKDERFKNEAHLREFIAEKYDGFYGVSDSNLGKKFSLAKKALNGDL